LLDAEKGKGLIRELTPSTKRILKIFDPITLPTAISTFFLYAATTDVASSGSYVPTATIVSPIRLWLIPILAAS
jgi:hypothetical protein